MCGRFALTSSAQEIEQYFQVGSMETVAANFNITPTQAILTIRLSNEGLRETAWLRWGLIPYWAKAKANSATLINARVETVAEKPAFQRAFKTRRCLIVATGFYEWKKAAGSKQPYYIQHSAAVPFAFAGLWEHWQNNSGDVIESCTILTKPANSLLAPIHERMPIVLPPQDYKVWLDALNSETDFLKALLTSAEVPLIAYPVTKQMGSPSFNSPLCVVALD